MTQATSPASVSKERAREAMARFVAVWEQGELAAVDEIFSKDLTYHAPPFPDMGRDGFRDFVDSFRAGFTEIHVQMQEHLVDGATSVHRWTVEAVLSGTTPLLPGVEATGKRTTGEGAHVLHWSGDEVSEAWHFGDWLGWLTKAGVLPPMPGTGA
ncbi:SnoaL-like polyketide cyclase [Geodermatophilus africanus]|uniref:SnoaL-like polyketide cyclase n=1 Tax=Geodermatophilus africanus TaxID=1137993 RepID=A0A1H3CTD9_9ACTN|nr:ester cyclase [Geodermatophilus africanus]SDX57407.1 SnoaL-like polyketide cyclase [Geodermatophilus africanus]